MSEKSLKWQGKKEKGTVNIRISMTTCRTPADWGLESQSNSQQDTRYLAHDNDNITIQQFCDNQYIARQY